MRKEFLLFALVIIAFLLFSCKKMERTEELEISELEESTGLQAEIISYENIIKGVAPLDYLQRAGAEYKPSHNEDSAIPVQCWIETSYGTQNACKYCHTNYLAEKQHGNSFPIAEDQILYSFPSPNLNRVNWRNIIAPQEIIQRLKDENVPVPERDDQENLLYIRIDNWREAYRETRSKGESTWNNLSSAGEDFQLFPALNPDDLCPFSKEDPTHGGQHGYIDEQGFVRDKNNVYSGWRAVNFFPYAIFTPLTGSVSGIYVRLPDKFTTQDGVFSLEIYKKNLGLLEQNIKDEEVSSQYYFGDARDIAVKKGFYPLGTEFAHPLHYVDLHADGEAGVGLDGLDNNENFDYEFPGTRSKRVKEIRYMYKWKEVGLADIGAEEEEEKEEEEIPYVLGNEGKGWIDNDKGWIIAAYIEDRKGDLRPQTTEELLQCLGCHSSVGNTIDAVWSFQRKLPGEQGWKEMDYGSYRKSEADKTRLQDYYNQDAGMGELEYFYYTVVGADLFGVMPVEIKNELKKYVEENNLMKKLKLKNTLQDIFDDEKLKTMEKKERKGILQERARIMRTYASSRSYLYHCETSGRDYIKGNIFYPTESTMKANIAGYRRIVLDQSFNLGKNVFGTQPDAIPFTFRSDGTVLDSKGNTIPVGGVIGSRPWGEDGVGITPTGIVRVNKNGQPVDKEGNIVDIEKNPEKADGHISTGGTFETRYNPIIKGKPVAKEFRKNKS